uniref:SPRY domain-containing protein n=1 Tax=Biomphalaria glabrata TaxID=6526 RepID=A0A2C9KE11_BIOGL
MSQFRCTADIVFDELDLKPGQICNVHLKQYSETCNFLQYLKPLTPEKPYFYAQIKSLNANSKITLGIAGPDIAPEAQPGNWLDSVGYQSDTGQCYTCHQRNANTIGEKFGVGDLFGVLF